MVNKSIKTKQAFTIAELLIVIAIVGVLSVIGLNTFKSFDKGIRYVYSNAYHAIDRAFYNSTNYTSLNSPFAKEDEPFEESNDEHALSKVSDKDKERVYRLCKMFVQYIDNVQDHCDAGATATPKGDTFGDKDGNPSFVAINGIRFYITNILPDEEHLTEDGHRFFIVYADINGENGPNSMSYRAGTSSEAPIDPDIFAFAALDIGRICPLGPPEVDARFMQTRVLYHDYISDAGAGGEEDNVTVAVKFSTVSKPYYISKAEAWGYYINKANIPTGTDEEKNMANYYPPSDATIMVDDNPYMYNGYIKKVLADSDYADNMIYSFLNGSEIPRADANGSGIHLMSGKISTHEGYECYAGSDEECNIIIDKFLF